MKLHKKDVMESHMVKWLHQNAIPLTDGVNQTVPFFPYHLDFLLDLEKASASNPELLGLNLLTTIWA